MRIPRVALVIFHLIVQLVNYSSAFLITRPTKSSQPTQLVHFFAEKDAKEMDDTSAKVIEYDDFLPQPNPDLNAQDVVSACMNTMLQRKEAGLEVCFNFSSDRCRAALGGSLEKFSEYARNPVFGYLVHCTEWEIISIGPIIAGTPTRGAMQTVLMDAKQSKDEEEGSRRFLWTLQQERRPPRQGFWNIHEVIYVKNAFQLTL